MNEKLLSRMKPLLGVDSITNAGNACLTHDGAAFVYLSNKKGLLKFIASNLGQEIPSLVQRVPLKAQKLILKRTGLIMDDIDVVEWNEAFAIIDVLLIRLILIILGNITCLVER